MSDRHGIVRQKSDLRARMREMRDAVSPEERDRLTVEIGDRLMRLPAVERATTVTAFLSFGSEVPTDGLIARLAERRVRVGVPVLEEGEIRMAPYRLGDPVAEGAFGIRVPVTVETIAPREIDVVLTPGLAFDRRGFRLGYGGGFYDRFLRRLREDAVRIAIGFAQQIVDEVPHGPGDLPVHLVVTDRETVEAGSALPR